MLIIRRTWIELPPSLRVFWLGSYNAIRRWPLAGAAFGLSLVAVGALARISPVRLGIAAAARHAFAVLAITGLLFAMMIYRRRTALTRGRHRDWLAALPSELPLTARAAYVPFVGWACIAFAVSAAGVVSRPIFASSATVVLAFTAGFLAAVAAVAIIAALERRLELPMKRAGRRARLVPPASRYAVVHRPRTQWATRTSLVPLGYWPIAQAGFLERPKMRARSLVLLLLALPLDVPGAIALLAGAIWLLTMHLVSLLIAVVRVAFAAAWWLAPTPLGAARFAFAISHRALMSEIATCALLVFLAAGAAGPGAFHVALRSAVSWTAVAGLLSAAACLIALRSHSVAASILHRWIR